MDLLGMDSLSMNGPAVAPKAQPPPAPSLRLAPMPQLTPAEFQRLWGALQPLPTVQLQLTPQALAAIEADHHQVPFVPLCCDLHEILGSEWYLQSCSVHSSCCFVWAMYAPGRRKP